MNLKGRPIGSSVRRNPENSGEVVPFFGDIMIWGNVEGKSKRDSFQRRVVRYYNVG